MVRRTVSLGSAAIRTHWRRNVGDRAASIRPAADTSSDTTRFGGRRELPWNGFACNVLMNRCQRDPRVFECGTRLCDCGTLVQEQHARHQNKRRNIVACSCSWTLDAAFPRSLPRVLHSVIRSRNAAVIEYRMQDDISRQMVANHNPIGVFDSGVGGLSVLQALRQELPHEHFLYVGDSGCAPYGDRSADFVVERAITITEFLVGAGCKSGRGRVQHGDGGSRSSRFVRASPIPIVAIEPAVKPAASRTRSRVVGVLATTGTLSSPNMGKLLANYGSDVEFVIQPCPGLADQVEKGELASDETRALVTRYVRPIIDKGRDIVVLGCTHYPFLRPLIQEVAGPAVDIIDPATPVARELRRRLESAGLLQNGAAAGTERFWTTGAVEDVGPIVRQLWGRTLEVMPL